MAYSKELRERAIAELETRKENAKNKALNNKYMAYEKIPELSSIEKELKQTGVKISTAILKSADINKSIEQLKSENFSLRERRSQLLKENGFSQDFLNIHYQCDKCEDTGFIKNELCTCHEEILRNLLYNNLSNTANLDKYSFENFDINFYPNKVESGKKSPRDVMRDNLNKAMDYAQSFTYSSPSLLLLGKTGLGKTHLSLAIAKAIGGKGFDVLYSSAQNLLNKLEKEKFSSQNSGNFEDYLSVILSCDLLIIDDLGAEFSTSFTVSAIYNIINSRLLQSKPTIINSNLDTVGKIKEFYSERIVSRLLGNYNLLTFMGDDIRIIKKFGL